jgi:signal-induced proliferation-associated 1 like protein 1/signal-induced proliferation-associated 1 like protein 2
MEAYTRPVEFLVVKDETMSDELLVFESRDMRVTPHFKIGILYCAKGQTTEEQMFTNSEGSPDYDRFLELIGEKIVLAGWNRYNGGLDIKGPNTTGTHSHFTTFSGYDIMFHVSTMFPFSTEGGAQQVHKKRHLGNDIILVVFQDEGAEDYIPNCVRSQYIQVTIVVRKMKNSPDSPGETYYKVSVVRNSDVASFGPPLPFPAIMKHGPEFRSWLLYKIVNGELASYRSALFIKQLGAGFRSQCETLHEKYIRAAESQSTAEVAGEGMRKGIKVAGKAVSGLGKGMNKLIGGKKEKDKDDKRDSFQ